MFEEDVREEACGYLGREITDAEWKEALPAAKRKLERIISREGDLEGERRKPYYLGKLVEEHIRENAVMKYINEMGRLNMERRKTHETLAAHA